MHENRKSNHMMCLKSFLLALTWLCDKFSFRRNFRSRNCIELLWIQSSLISFPNPSWKFYDVHKKIVLSDGKHLIYFQLQEDLLFYESDFMLHPSRQQLFSSKKMFSNDHHGKEGFFFSVNLKIKFKMCFTSSCVWGAKWVCKLRTEMSLIFLRQKIPSDGIISSRWWFLFRYNEGEKSVSLEKRTRRMSNLICLLTNLSYFRLRNAFSSCHYISLSPLAKQKGTQLTWWWFRKLDLWAYVALQGKLKKGFTFEWMFIGSCST